MALIKNHRELVRYKLRHIGLRNTVRVAYLDFFENISYSLAKHFSRIFISPRSIQIECTTRCNLKCTFCEHTYWTDKPADLKFDDFQKMVSHLPKLNRIDLTGIGESLLNRDFFKIIEFLKSRDMYVTLNNNFTLMTEATARRIVELEVDQIFLSLDGATKQTFEQIRVGANFEKVISNARQLVRIRHELFKKKPEVKINTVVCLTNLHELTSLVELAYDMGIGMVQFVNVITFQNTEDLDIKHLNRELQQALRSARNRARELGIVVKVELFDKIPVQRCDFPWKRNFVTHDGYVHPCCFTTQNGERQAQNRISFGNLIGRSFKEIWRGQNYSEFRKKMRQGILPKACVRCPKYYGEFEE